jgi:hypothetical protein
MIKVVELLESHEAISDCKKTKLHIDVYTRAFVYKISLIEPFHQKIITYHC